MMYDYDYSQFLDLLRQLFAGTGGYFAIICFASFISIAARVFVCLAVAYDAKAIAVTNKTLWIVLSAIFPICGFIYLCARNSLKKDTPKFCVLCGTTSPPNAQYCVNCHAANLVDYKTPNGDALKKKRNVFAIIGVVLVLLSFGLSRYGSAKLSERLIQNYQDYSRSQREYQLPDFGNDFGNEFNFDFDGDMDDFEDFFNNFGN